MSVPTIRKLAVIAGGGDLPLRIANSWAQAGRPVFVLGLEGFAESWIGDFPHATASITAAAEIKKLLLESGCDGVTFAGRVARPDFRSLRATDRELVKLLGKVVLAAMRGDDAVMRVVIDHVASWGLTVVPPDQVLGELRISRGSLTDLMPDQAARADIKRGMTVVKALGEFDFGQGCVVCDGYVLAVEAAEGTDAMLLRVAQFPESIRGTAAARRGVLVKVPKPQQDRRFDLPTIGRRTVEGVAAAGLAGIAVEAEAALVVDRDAVAALAARLGIFVVAVDGAGNVD